MGGDLADALVCGDSLTCYVADVSGHGVAAGLLMGMVKTGVRMSLLRGAELEGVLRELHGVLPGLKEPSSYVTFAGLLFNQPGLARYATAGHGPILHYRYETDTVERLSTEQFPVGIIPAAEYYAATTRYGSGDVFLMLTDGIVEVANTSDEDFGLDRVERLLIENSARPLTEFAETLIGATRVHGHQMDDQTILIAKIIG